MQMNAVNICEVMRLNYVGNLPITAVLVTAVLRCDPLKLLIQFLTDKNIRPVDLFRLFDKDKQYRVTREQFVSGLKVLKLRRY